MHRPQLDLPDLIQGSPSQVQARLCTTSKCILMRSLPCALLLQKLKGFSGSRIEEMDFCDDDYCTVRLLTITAALTCAALHRLLQ